MILILNKDLIPCSLNSALYPLNFSSFPMLFNRLPFCEQLLLWAVRKWVETPQDDNNLHKTLQTAFRLAKAPDAYVALDGFLTVLFTSTTQTIDFRPHRSQEISADEYRFLALIATLQGSGNGKGAGALMATWMPQAAQRIGLEQCELLSRELARANHRLCPREVGVLDMSANSFKRQPSNTTTNVT